MNKVLKISIFVLALIFIIMLDDYTYMSYHEDSHVQGYRFWNVSSSVYIPLFGDTGIVTPEKNCPNDECKQVQIMAEIIGYHTYAVITTLWMMLGVVFMFYLMFVKKWEKKRRK